MLEIKTVLCPVDFTPLVREELNLALGVCEAFGARLILHHNMSAAPPGLTRAWEWNKLHRDDREPSGHESEQRLRDLLAELPASVAAEAAVSRGPLATVLTEIAKALPADLIVLGSHGSSTADHASLTERVIDACPCPVLTLHEGADASRFPFHAGRGTAPTPVLVPADLSASAAPVVGYALDLAATAPLDIHLLHVVGRHASAAADDYARTQMEALADARPGVSVTCHIERGEPVEAILKLAADLGAGLLVLGEHSRSYLLRLFIQDTARAVLHRARCPVWFIPARASRKTA